MAPNTGDSVRMPRMNLLTKNCRIAASLNRDLSSPRTSKLFMRQDPNMVSLRSSNPSLRHLHLFTTARVPMILSMGCILNIVCFVPAIFFFFRISPLRICISWIQSLFAASYQDLLGEFRTAKSKPHHCTHFIMTTVPQSHYPPVAYCEIPVSPLSWSSSVTTPLK